MSNATLCAYYRQKRKKEKMTNAMMNRRNWLSATITLKMGIILNRAFADKLNKYKPSKSKRMPLSMFIRYNKKILYFTKYFHIKNGWRI